MGFCHLHRHDHFSVFDGFGTAKQAARYAADLGQKALALTNHGNVSGLVEHYHACKEVGIHPVLGCEIYFQPKFDPTPGAPRYHLTILCKTTEGYHNLAKMLSVAARDHFYRAPIVDYRLLAQYSRGLVCLSGCMLGYIPRLILDKKLAQAEVERDHFLELFGDDFYLEHQPINIKAQRKINQGLIMLGEAESVVTTDAHFVRPDDYDSYLMMYRLGEREPATDYSQRYLMGEEEIRSEYQAMHGENPYLDRTEEIALSCDVDLTFKEMVPKVDWSKSSKKTLRNRAQEGLERIGKSGSKRYQAQLQRELDVVFSKGFEDYFLILYDLISFADKNGIARGFGRGSVCGSLLAYCIGLTKVDPFILGTHFERFLRPDKNVLPDVDLDFDSARRQEVIDYLLQKYEGRSLPITTFGYYRAKNLCNDLGKVLEVSAEDLRVFKELMTIFTAGDQEGAYSDISYESAIEQSRDLRRLDKRYKGLVRYFFGLYGQIRFMGRHAAGIAITAEDIEKYVPAIRIRGQIQTSYDMDSLARAGIVKIDVLGLATVSVMSAISRKVGVEFDYSILDDEEVYARFAAGDTDGIFQFEGFGAKKVLQDVNPTNIQDVIACNALNRPGPIQLGVLDQFVAGKNGDMDNTPWQSYTQETYGTIVYQEQVMRICREIGKMEWPDTDKVMKTVNAKALDPALQKKFVEGATQNGFTKGQARELYRRMTLYLFNKNHGAAYTLMAVYQMWLRINYPVHFWATMLRFEKLERKRRDYMYSAVKDGAVILLPHVNASALDRVEKLDGEEVIRLGIGALKTIGVKTGLAIQAERKANGKFEDEDDFIARVPKRNVNKARIKVLEENGALEFDQAKFMRRVVAFNSALVGQNG